MDFDILEDPKNDLTVLENVCLCMTDILCQM